MQGHLAVCLKSSDPYSTEWARLVTDVKPTLVKDFIDTLLKGNSEQDGNFKYLFDWSIPLFAPQLMEDFKVPLQLNSILVIM